MSPLGVIPVENPSQDIRSLLPPAREEGFQFLDRLIRDWDNKRNRFDGPGEDLRVAILPKNRVCGICGLNIDPYMTSGYRTGRLRHLYVHPEFRHRGVATKLMKYFLNASKKRFDVVRLRTDNLEAAAFYARFGFRETTEPNATHYKRILPR